MVMTRVMQCNVMLQTFTYPWVDDTGTDFTNVERVVVTTASIGVRVDKGRILPSLRKASIVEENVALLELL
jgi:hypothetical protein